MSDPMQPEQPTEEEIRAYLQQVREADPAAIIVQAYRMLGEGAEVKLGRSDARVLIDAMNAVTDAVQGTLPEELLSQMRDGVRQLQTAQVEAESAAGGEQAGSAGSEQAKATQPPPAAQQPQGSAPMTGQPRLSEPTDPKPSDRLWIPGR